MPTSGTHITIVQRLAADPSLNLSRLLGDPGADEATPAGRMMRFANLGAVGPDIFYAMADYGSDLQDLENFLTQALGSFQCISDLLGKVDRYVSGLESEITGGISDSLQQTFNLVGGTLNQIVKGILVDAGLNFWPVFEAQRQQDHPREQWYWADYLHYIRTGQFATQLLTYAKQRTPYRPNLYAYALGYLTHYVVDVVGHPYVNEVVQAPWRLYWQRHHLVENFIDAYVWDRWHTPKPKPEPPSTEEQPLDAVTLTTNAMGNGASFTFARLHDLIKIGIPSVGDPVDAVVAKVCQEIEQGLLKVGVVDHPEAPPPDDDDFRAWTQMMAATIQQVYPGQYTLDSSGRPKPNDPNMRHPARMMTSVFGFSGTPRPNGYPLPEDIAGAYGTMRLFLKLTTEELIQAPKAPDLGDDINHDVQKIWDRVKQDLSSIPPPDFPHPGGSFSWDALWKAIRDAATYLFKVADALGKAVFDFIRGLTDAGIHTLTFPIRRVLYELNKGLFALYRGVRQTLVLAAYTPPFTEELELNLGSSFNTSSLWRIEGPGVYPVEEYVQVVGSTARAPQRDKTGSTYAPFFPPNAFTANLEQPAPSGPSQVSPYRPPAAPGAVVTPDVFIGNADDPRRWEMFNGDGPIVPDEGFADGDRDFGGAMANCVKAIQIAENDFSGGQLPDYNLDGDRGYGWLCWDVKDPVEWDVPADPNDATYVTKVKDPLDPTDPRNAPYGWANVTAVEVRS